MCVYYLTLAMTLGSLLNLKDHNQDVGQAGFSSGDLTGKESASKLSQKEGLGGHL